MYGFFPHMLHTRKDTTITLTKYAPDNYYAGFHWKKKKINKKEENHFRKGRGKAKAVTLAMFHYTLL